MNKKYMPLLVLALLFVMAFSADAAPRRIAIFVNGNQDCCAWSMEKVQKAFQGLNIEQYFTPWNSLEMISGNTSENQSPKVTAGATTNFINHMKRYFSSLQDGTEVFLIGHSFGGDSILRFIEEYRRSKIKIRFVAVLDSVTTAGYRSHHSVYNNVDYFFNRWQTNAPWPVDIGSSGKVQCRANTCDQKEQSISRHPNGSARKTECKKYENCPGAEIRYQGINSFYYPGEKQTRLHHSYVPTDPYIEQQIISIVTNLVKHPPKTKNFNRVGSGNEWKIAPIAIATQGSSLYIIENATLYRVNPNTGAYQNLGKNWSKSPIAMTALGKFLYVIENATLFRVNPNTGAYQNLGKNWSKSPIAMTALGKFLYVIENATLYRVNPNSGKYDNLGKNWSKGPIALTAFRSNLYIVENKSLWRVN